MISCYQGAWERGRFLLEHTSSSATEPPLHSLSGPPGDSFCRSPSPLPQQCCIPAFVTEVRKWALQKLDGKRRRRTCHPGIQTWVPLPWRLSEPPPSQHRKDPRDHTAIRARQIRPKAQTRSFTATDLWLYTPQVPLCNTDTHLSGLLSGLNEMTSME